MKPEITNTDSSQGIESLLEPLTVGPVTLKNRIFLPAHTTNFSGPPENEVTRRYVRYLRERALGGVGMIITEGLRVHPTSLRRLGLQIYDDSAIEGYSRLVEEIHASGSALFAQILHSGRHVAHERLGAWAPSALPWSTGAEIPHAMNRDDISELLAGYRASIRRARQAGLDGIELHLGHGHLLQQFLSPATNQRTDGYGGSPENRLRLAREVLEVVGDEIGEGQALGLRVSASEFMPDGLDLDEMIGICTRLRDEFPLHFIHVSHSAYVGDYSLSTQVADMTFGPMPFREFPAAFKRALPDVKIFAVCRVDDLATAASVVREGEADLAGMARAHIAEPHLLKKTLEGKNGEIRSCISCNQGCIGNIEKSLPITCVVNPEVGLEAEWHDLRSIPARRVSRALVIGGGPAGLEAATGAARGGNEVTLVESNDSLGGQVRLASRLRGREKLSLLVDELERDVRGLGVDVRLNTTFGVEEIEAGAWDSVVIATGSLPHPYAEGGELPNLSTWQAIQEPDLAGRSVVIEDEDGGWAGAGLAEEFAFKGREVDLVIPTANLFWRITVYSKTALMRRLGEAGVRIRLLRRVVATKADGTVTLQDTVTGDEEELRGISSVVRSGPQRALDDLYLRLRSSGYPGEVHLVGDAYSPRSCLEAVYEGRAAGTSVGVASRAEASIEFRYPRSLAGVGEGA